jgi:hypothetical protein
LKITKGKLQRPPRVLVYGAEKIGKSTFASGAPKPVWLGKDSGTEELDVSRMPQPETWEDVLASVEWFRSSEFETLVVDPINWLEPLCHASVVGNSGKSIADWGGGYGRGHAAALIKWREFVAALERAWNAGKAIVLLAHSAVKKFDNPEGASYNRYSLDMSDAPAGLLKQWVDAVLFAQRESTAKTLDGKTIGVGTGARMLYTTWSPAYDAGNRWGLPEEIPLEWASIVRSTADVASIEADLASLNDASVSAKVRAALSKPGAPVAQISQQLKTKLKEARAS